MLKFLVFPIIGKIIEAITAQTVARKNAKAINEGTRGEIPGNLVVVPIKPSKFSKIEWMQVIGPAATVLAALASYYGLNLSGDEIAGVVMAGFTVHSIITWVLKKWYTASISPQSARKVGA